MTTRFAFWLAGHENLWTLFILALAPAGAMLGVIVVWLMGAF